MIQVRTQDKKNIVGFYKLAQLFAGIEAEHIFTFGERID
jgi:hypothetical protein